jgi:hypothetical protein
MRTQALVSTSLLVLLACGGEATTAPAASATTPGASPQYQIVVHRPLAAGARFRVVVDAQEKIEGVENMTGATQASSNDINHDVHLSLTGIVTVREVDKDGRALSATLDVERFTASPKDAELVPTGTRLDFVRGQGDFSVMVNGTPRPDLMKQLRLAFPLQRPGSPLGDALFGSKQPRQVGDSWDFSKSLVAQSMLDDGYKITETNLTGDTRLMGVSSVGGVECLELASKLHADHAAVSEQSDVQGVGSGKLDATIKLVVPTNPALPVAMEEATTHGEFQAHVGDDTASSQTGVTITRYRRALYTQMAASPAP